jgi:hypothetical protein
MNNPRHRCTIESLAVRSIALCCLLLFGTARAEIEVTKLPAPAAHQVDYTNDVQPLLAAHCVKCHGAKRQAADLRLDTRSALLKGGENGKAVRPGKSAESRLIVAVSQLDPELSMPPEGDPLTDEQVGLLRAWIDQGAKGPDDAAAASRPIPWSFRPVARPGLPGKSESIDALVAVPLREKNLTISPEADRRALIRRVYLVMHGLPPTPAEVEQFLNDKGPDAYEQLVDRVLASPRYGERWARHWLDLVRFAESNGFETNRVRQNAWPYRDYVIRSFNEDKPYDQFVREQIAGDAMDDDAATGFLVAGACDLVKSPDINLTLMQRQDELADIVNTTGTAFLGLTLGCARCHDHKFDPISQADYYAIQAVFAGVNFAPRPMREKLDADAQQELAAAQTELASRTAELDGLRRKAREETSPGRPLRARVNERLNEETFPPVTTKAVRFTILATNNSSEPCLDELEIYDGDGKNVALATTGARPSASGTLPGYKIHQLAHLNDGLTGNDHSWISNTAKRGWVRIEFATAQTISRIIWGRDRSGRFQDRVAVNYRVEAATEAGDWKLLASAEDREPFGSNDPNEFLKQLSTEDAAVARLLQSRIGELQSRVAQLTNGLSAWLGTFSQPEPTHRLYRGDPLQKREVVAPDALSQLDVPGLPGSLGMAVDAPEKVRRIKLAEWIASPANPLTARVMVNRLWHYIFGAGIVETPSDFGGNGAAPLNPALLDWLADEFVHSGWSIKHMQRLILLSQTFRQSAAPRLEGLAADADARFLWRFPPRRLEAEAIRDCILATSGALNLRMGGPGFFLQIVEEDNVYRYFPKEQFGPEEFRRMVYLNRVRQEQDSVFGSFDCPSGNQVMPRRSRSNTPLQALNLFNSPFVLQQAELFAARLLQEAGETPPAQVRRAFVLFASRAPDAEELELSVELIRQQGLAAFCRALFNTSEFLFLF